MANTMRWRYGETNPVMAPVDSATVIEIGDLVYLDGAAAKPASDQADQGAELANQTLFQDAFLGVAMQASSSGDTDAIRVSTTGVFEFECDTTTHEVGDLIGAGETTAGDGLASQRVAVAPNAAAAIGRSVARVNPAADRLLVDLISSVMRGGVQEAA